MGDTSPGEVTRLLAAIRSGDKAAEDELARLVKNELRRRAAALMKRERPDHTLQPSDLVQQTFVRLLSRDELKNAANRNHLMALVTKTMRRILVEHARARKAAKRGGNAQRVPLDAVVDYFEKQDVDVLDLDEALQDLGRVRPEPCQAITLRYLGGFTLQEVAAHLNVSVATVQTYLQFARAWLFSRMRGSDA